jgi:hypothetical protein
VGIEPTHKGFADLSLTTWVPRLNLPSITDWRDVCQRSRGSFYSIRTGLVNPRRTPGRNLALCCFTFLLALRFALRGENGPTLRAAWD